MKRLMLFITAVMLVLIPKAVFCEDIVSFVTNGASSPTGTGFRLDTSGEYKIVDVDGGESTALYIGNNATIYHNSWSSTAIDYLVISTRVMTKDNMATKAIKMRMPDTSRWNLFEINPNSFSSCSREIPDLAVEKDRWYDVKIALKKNPSYMVEVYIDGVKVSSNSFPELEALPQAGLQIRIEAGEGGGLYLGNTKLYTPPEPSAELVNARLSAVDEPVLIKLDSTEIDTSTLTASNVKVTDNTFGNEQRVELETTEDGIKLTFPEGIREDNSYTVDLDGVLDVAGQGFGKHIFFAPSPETPYASGDVRLYKGFDIAEEITALTSTAMTAYIDVKNGGIQKRGVALVCAMYTEGVLSGISVAETVLDADEQSELITSIAPPETGKKAELMVMLWDGFSGKPIKEVAVFKN